MRLLRNLLFLLLFILVPANGLRAAEDPEARARRLINALGCKGCHQIKGDGGSLAPPLDQIGSRLTREQIEKQLAAHSDRRPGSLMPSYGTTPSDDLKIISEFIYNLR